MSATAGSFRGNVQTIKTSTKQHISRNGATAQRLKAMKQIICLTPFVTALRRRVRHVCLKHFSHSIFPRKYCCRNSSGNFSTAYLSMVRGMVL